MFLLDKIFASRDARRAEKGKEISQELANQFRLSPLFSDYENVFAQVRPLIDAMKMVVPYGVSDRGVKLAPKKTPELEILKNPNDEMGWAEFADLMFATWLTEDELDVHVWKDDKGNVEGYTVLPPSARSYKGDGQYQWNVQTKDGMVIYDDMQVARLRFSRSPRNPSRGVSPASSIKTWAQIDDLIGQYQRAYFENGAVPATITFINASTKDKYEATRRELEMNLKGAENKNKTVYVWRQFDNDTGQSVDQIEVKTIQGNNSTLAIKDIVSIVNDKLNKSVGVSNFILGDDSSAKYDNAELSDHQFTKRRVYPALVGFWNQFQSELDRITGGLGYAIGFDLEIPELTERERAKSEVARIKTETMISLINAGASGASVVEALELSKKWQNLANDLYAKSLIPDFEYPQELNYATKKPAEATIDAKDSTKCEHKDHTHTLDKLPPMTKEEKAVYDKLVDVAKMLIAEKEVITDNVVEEMTVLLNEYAKKGGKDGAKAVALLANKDIKGEILKTVSKGEIYTSKALESRIKSRAEQLVVGYTEHTKNVIQGVLDTTTAMTANERTAELMKVLPYQKAELIARNETLYAIRSGRLEQDKELAEKYGLKIGLVWRTSGDGAVCDVCQAMEGKTTDLGKPFHGENIDDSWQSNWNDHGQIPDAHPNCRCYFDEELV